MTDIPCINCITFAICKEMYLNSLKKETYRGFIDSLSRIRAVKSLNKKCKLIESSITDREIYDHLTIDNHSSIITDIHKMFLEK